MEIRLVSRDEEANTVKGKLVRVTRTRVQVKSPDGLLHWCNRHNGTSLGERSAYNIHPDDVHLIQGAEAEAMVSKTPRKQRTQHANHWNV